MFKWYMTQETYKNKNNYSLSSFNKIEINDNNIKKYKSLCKGLSHVRTGKEYKGFIYLNNNEVVAYINVNTKQACIQAIEVMPKYRKQGLSKQLLDVCVNELKATNLSVNKKNKLAHDIYTKYGFKTYKEDKYMNYMSLNDKVVESLHIVTEAPGDQATEIGPTDYGAAEQEMNDADQDGNPDPGTETADNTADEDLGPDDYNDDNTEGEDAETGVDDPTAEETGEEGEATDTEDGMGDETAEEPMPEENGDKTKNTFLIRDFMNLYFTSLNLVEKVNNIKKTSLIKNKIYLQVAKNINEMNDTLYDYIVNNFSNNSYVFNLYQFNLFLEVLNVNVEMLKKSGELSSNK